MRFLFSIVLIAILSLATEYFFPWWSLAVICFLVIFIFRFPSGKAFLAGFLSITILWLAVALFKDNANEYILSTRMAELFHLPNSILFVVVASLIGGLVGGLAAWSGCIVRNYFAQRS